MFPDLLQDHNDVSFLQIQLILGFSLVVEQDLATFRRLGEAERRSAPSRQRKSAFPREEDEAHHRKETRTKCSEVL